MLTWGDADGRMLITTVSGRTIVACAESLDVLYHAGRMAHWRLKGVGPSRPGGLRLEPGVRDLTVNIPGCGRVVYERCTPAQSLAARAGGVALPALLREWFEGRPGVDPVGCSLIIPTE